MSNILGISAFYHDSAAALCCNGEIVAAASEERFSRKKADASIPVHSIEYCLSYLNGEELDAIVYYDNPFWTLDRWLDNCIATSPNNNQIIDKSFLSIYGKKMWIHEALKRAVGKSGQNSTFYVCEHHISHAASAFYPSPFEEAAIITIDGVGEWATTTIGRGKGTAIELIEQISYPHSLGLLYSAFTYFCGFKVNFGEYKLMGLAPYGDPKYYETIKESLITINEDGSFQLNLDYFAFTHSNVMTNEKFEELFGVKRRIPEDKITGVYMDLAASIQKVTEEIIIKIAKHARKLTNCRKLVMAGGVALNCVANGKLIDEGIFDSIWIQPAAGDAGGALGAALFAAYNEYHDERSIKASDDQKGSFLGPSFSNKEIEEYLNKNGYQYHFYGDDSLYDLIAEYLKENKVIGVLNGRMEFGPRALGGRSIIANPMSEEMQSKLNLKIKFRESFRPFAPAVLKERVQDYFEFKGESPYMLFVAQVKKALCQECDNINTDKDNINMIDIINQRRSAIPAVTHIDYSARVQTVDEERNPFFYKIIKCFEEKTGCGVVVNTSFNVRGEPIVCSPEDAYKCFMRTDMDILVMENYILIKSEQKDFVEEKEWKELYELD